uniref:Uncharacterized protein n=1 Tax=Firmicutes bacterium enrichment culture clone fosmid MGS-M1 TaxID=1549348 RepID=A0A0B5KU80_9FIRM|nr:hypothetical protein [Firmicutes bacterium enrichment culture clone fosmid MGS-M1]
MKILKALLPMVVIILIRILVQPTFNHHEFEKTVFTGLLLVQITFFSVVLFGLIYFWKNRVLRISFIILSVFVLINIIVGYGPLFFSSFDIPYHFTIIRSNFSLFFFFILSIITVFVAIRSKHIVAIVFAGITLLLVIYVELFYGPELLAEPFRSYDPYEEFRVLLKAGFYRSMLQSTVTIILISLPVFTSFYALLKSQK